MYPSFADALPSLGLLLLRVATGTALAVHCWEALENRSPALITLHLLAIGVGVLLVLGLWTRIAGVIVAAVELLGVYSHSCHPWLSVLLSSLGAVLSLLGPGCWSVDARLSGWKRINIPSRHQ